MLMREEKILACRRLTLTSSSVFTMPCASQRWRMLISLQGECTWHFVETTVGHTEHIHRVIVVRALGGTGDHVVPVELGG